MATYFDTDNIPEDLYTPALGAQHFESALKVIQDAIARGEVAAFDTNAAYVSERDEGWRCIRLSLPAAASRMMFWSR